MNYAAAELQIEYILHASDALSTSQPFSSSTRRALPS